MTNKIEEIGVISIDRSRNCAYIWHSLLEPKEHYWATNMEVELDWLEDLFGCKFNDGVLPHYISVKFYEHLNELPKII